MSSWLKLGSCLMLIFLVACGSGGGNQDRSQSAPLTAKQLALFPTLENCHNKSAPANAPANYCAPSRIYHLLNENQVQKYLDLTFDQENNQIIFLSKQRNERPDEDVQEESPNFAAFGEYVQSLSTKFQTYDEKKPGFQLIYNPALVEKRGAAAVVFEKEHVLYIGHYVLLDLLSASSLDEILNKQVVLPHEEFHIDQYAQLKYFNAINPAHGRLLCLDDSQNYNASAAEAVLFLLGQSTDNKSGAINNWADQSIEEGYGHMISLRNMLNSYKYMPNEKWQKKNVREFLTTVLKYTRMAYRLNSYLYYYWQNKSDQAGDGGIAAEDLDGIWIENDDIYLYYQTRYKDATDYHYKYALTIPRQALRINVGDDPYDIPTMSKILSFLKNQNIYLAQLYDLAKDLANIMLENDEVGTFKEGWQKSAEQLMERFSSLHPSKYKDMNYNSGVNLPYEGKTDYIDRINNDTIPFKWEKTYLFN